MSPKFTVKKSNIILVLLVTIITVGLDQITKLLVLRVFQLGELRPVIDNFFNLTLTFNRGAAFGLWTGLAPGLRELVLTITIVLALCVVAFLLTRSYYQMITAQVALAAILGGAIGNVIDRLRYGAVVDFLDFYIGATHWPAFNIADSAICIGVGLLLLQPRPPELESTLISHK